MGFAVERTLTSDSVRVAVTGEVDIETGPRLRRAIESAVDEARASARAQVVVWLGDVTYLDSSGLAALIAGRVRANATGVGLTLQQVPPRVMKVLKITGLETLLTATPAPTDRSAS